MKHTIRQSILPQYSLHDMAVTELLVDGDDMVLRSESGILRTTPVCRQFDGYLKFQDVQWDLCYVYLMEISGNEGLFSGQKISLKNFMDRYKPFGFCVMDETYGYNMTKYSGYLTTAGHHYECIVELYHEGGIIFVDETNYEGMAEVILSADDDAKIWLIPAEVAADLDNYCGDFAVNWVWHGPENGKFLRLMGSGQYGAVFGAGDFIDYLNKWVFPDRESKLVRNLGCYGYEIPEEYRDIPKYNL